MPTEDNRQRALPLLLTSPTLLMNFSERSVTSSNQGCSNSSSSARKLGLDKF